jgi:hypothetical protein
VRPLIVLVTLVLASSCQPRHCDEPARPVATGATPLVAEQEALRAVDTARVNELRNQLCTACHMLVEPGVLPRSAWPWVTAHMAILSGQSVPEWESLSELERSRLTEIASGLATNRIPVNEATADDWAELAAWYSEQAPVSLEGNDRFVRPTSVGGDCHVGPPATREKFATTAVLMDEQSDGDIWLGQAVLTEEGMRGVWGRTQPGSTSEGEFWEVPSPPVSFERLGETMFAGLIGDLLPSNDDNGQIMELSASQPSSPAAVLVELPRLAHVSMRMVDGEPEFVASGFGFTEGEVLLLQPSPNGSRERVFAGPGAVRSQWATLDPGRGEELLALIAQSTEALVAWQRGDDGRWASRVLFQQGPMWGHVDFAVADVVGDSGEDLVVANGDNGDLPGRPARPYHGIRIYENRAGELVFHSFLQMHGAYNVDVADIDNDGDTDILAAAWFLPSEHPDAPGFVWWRNEGGGRPFSALVPACIPNGRWCTLDAFGSRGAAAGGVIVGGCYEPTDAAGLPLWFAFTPDTDNP